MDNKNKDSKLFLFALILYCSLLCVTCQHARCPPPEDVFPCHCRNVSYYGHIGCRHLNSEEKITVILNRVNQYRIGEFSLKESELKYVPKSVFNYGFRILEISFNAFERLFEEIPAEPKVQVLWMEQVRLQGSWDWRQFSALKDLLTLRLKRISLESLTHFKEVTKSLQHIVFEDCNLRNLNYDEFQHFPNLQMVDVQKNSLTVLKRSMFPKPSKLNFMVFNDNFISTIPEDLFVEMPYLRHINFSNNRLTVLSENIFLPVIRQKFLLDGNPLICDCRMAWILGTKRGWVAGSCASPRDMQGRELSELNDEDFTECLAYAYMHKENEY
ncbi:leucine-rich repeat and immunoglobulin-like domain-containing nogo receptor-interacting protein 1 [Parasteatoda tepidariorum]|uniref:leucine-rich repeat and immunoglobulin-like domain-containing nogo receptor-interacting protein 1 n=1 Tax=Parasteatoda tepidariorum TaxID=114398 RepID=UPI00077F907F|nr:leucine-rich repeat and immunoglobulin-like domain-containing nogo receptor-interacting protein 1 [Parasteatoda tepidariorum]